MSWSISIPSENTQRQFDMVKLLLWHKVIFTHALIDTHAYILYEHKCIIFPIPNAWNAKWLRATRLRGRIRAFRIRIKNKKWWRECKGVEMHVVLWSWKFGINRLYYAQECVSKHFETKFAAKCHEMNYLR